MKHISLNDLEVSRLGPGCMGMSAYYSGAGVDDAESIRTIHRAIELGISLIDTAEIYGPYTNEELVGRAIADRRDDVVLATKFGGSRTATAASEDSTGARKTSARRSRDRSGASERITLISITNTGISALGSRAGDNPPGACRAPGDGPAERVLAARLTSSATFAEPVALSR
jgi:hypothetical protein